ncbi:isopentenyl-diphosphate Delta-isomerase [Roseobacter sp. HKCCA0434]|uniref:isopentenyl-diphosphate Delta-isomerase n=1 Tax=Roseobacter sp. HKCCA0434 TaxID=3079297 RepID=UPI002905A835|nr:NUDIX domain-containing protein [Roseobacter sp. HKCCA0434]
MKDTDILIPAWEEGELRALPKLDVHRRGLRHLAVSVFAMHRGETLLQRRALSKYHSGGLWSNACCTHPAWNEDAEHCARRRMREELNIEVVGLQRLGSVRYRADVGSGLTEDEEVAMFAVELPRRALPAPNPDEVAEVRWTGWDALEREIAQDPARFTPWLSIYLSRHREMVVGVT